ncbi:hypothetical protein [Neptuniibacter sp. QD37_11]|uniref:type IVB secretion system protein IcmW n=1 Tax=Neptuniibacter sp. QD37_11 TaxID=3398209 RepID=UPI0039F63D6B
MATATMPSKHLFHPDAQEMVWSKLTPDIRIFLEQFESKEGWAYAFEEYPELYDGLADILPKLAADNGEMSSETIDQLIVLLSTIKMRPSISAIAWLDNQGNPDEIGKGGKIIIEAGRAAKLDTQDPEHLHMKMFYDRVVSLMRTSLSGVLFSSLKDSERLQ